jgi:hypothetical protein
LRYDTLIACLAIQTEHRPPCKNEKFERQNLMPPTFLFKALPLSMVLQLMEILKIRKRVKYPGQIRNHAANENYTLQRSEPTPRTRRVKSQISAGPFSAEPFDVQKRTFPQSLRSI